MEGREPRAFRRVARNSCTLGRPGFRADSSSRRAARSGAARPTEFRGNARLREMETRLHGNGRREERAISSPENQTLGRRRRPAAELEGQATDRSTVTHLASPQLPMSPPDPSATTAWTRCLDSTTCPRRNRTSRAGLPGSMREWARRGTGPRRASDATVAHGFACWGPQRADMSEWNMRRTAHEESIRAADPIPIRAALSPKHGQPEEILRLRAQQKLVRPLQRGSKVARVEPATVPASTPGAPPRVPGGIHQARARSSSSKVISTSRSTSIAWKSRDPHPYDESGFSDEFAGDSEASSAGKHVTGRRNTLLGTASSLLGGGCPEKPQVRNDAPPPCRTRPSAEPKRAGPPGRVLDHLTHRVKTRPLVITAAPPDPSGWNGPRV